MKAPSSGHTGRGAPIAVTDHAVQRYIQRHRPDWTHADAKLELMRECRTATLHEVVGNEPIWRTQRGVLLVVRLDGTVATVLPMGSTKTNRRPTRRRNRA